MIEPSTEIAFRNDFALLCNARKIKLAAEIGTDRGIFAADFLSRWDGEHLYCVDPFTAYDEMNGPRECTRLQAVLALQPHYRRVRFIEVNSPDAISLIEPVHLPFEGFVYIDGSHLYENVAADIAAWWNLLGPRGILAGHDFDREHPGVMKAVAEFAQREGVTVRTTRERLASWYAYKTEPGTLIRRYFDDTTTANPRRA